MFKGKNYQNDEERNPYSKRNLANRGLVPGWLYWVGFALGFFWGWVFCWMWNNSILQLNNGAIHDPVKLPDELHPPPVGERSQSKIVAVMLNRLVVLCIIPQKQGNLADPVNAMLLTLEDRTTAEVKPVSFQKSKPLSVVHFLPNETSAATGSERNENE